jgi:hypothetical protein
MDMTHQEAEEKILKQAKQFQRTRGYLVKKFGVRKSNFSDIATTHFHPVL